jgi:hypothetical protein
VTHVYNLQSAGKLLSTGKIHHIIKLTLLYDNLIVQFFKLGCMPNSFIGENQ